MQDTSWLIQRNHICLNDSQANKQWPINSVPQIRGVCSILVVFSIICKVFSFKEDLPPTLTQIYDEYMCIKVLKYHEDLTTLNSIRDLPKVHDIYKVGKIAFDCIQRQKMVFESSDLQGLGEPCERMWCVPKV